MPRLRVDNPSCSIIEISFITSPPLYRLPTYHLLLTYLSSPKMSSQYFPFAELPSVSPPTISGGSFVADNDSPFWSHQLTSHLRHFETEARDLMNVFYRVQEGEIKSKSMPGTLCWQVYSIKDEVRGTICRIEAHRGELGEVSLTAGLEVYRLAKGRRRWNYDNIKRRRDYDSIERKLMKTDHDPTLYHEREEARGTKCSKLSLPIIPLNLQCLCSWRC